MLNMRKKILVVVLGLVIVAGAAHAATEGLLAVDPGPYTAATGYFPLYYTDRANLTLDLCLSKAVSPDPAAAGGLLCNLLPNPGVFDPALPIVFPVNFPDEAFYFTADTNVVGQGIDLIYIAHLEAAFAGGLPPPVSSPLLGDQITFARIRVRADIDVTVPGPGNYRVTHPYGVEDFTAVSAGRRVINLTRDIGIGAPGVFTGALAGDIGPFLRRSATEGGTPSGFIQGLDPVTLLPNGEFFIGDPNVPQFATGSPFGTNFVRVQRVDAAGIDVTSNQFFLSGRVWNGKRPTNVAVDRASYSRTVDPVTLAVTTRIDGFATTPDSTTASVCFRETLDLVPPAPGNPCKITMTRSGNKVFGQDGNAPLVPPYIVVTATDPTAATPTTPTPIAQALGDVVKVTKAQYAKDTRTLLINAISSDQAAPPKITALGLGVLTPVPGTIADQRLQKVLPAEPPAFVTLVSSGGGRHTEPVTVVATAPANRSPVANPDTATTAEDTPVIIAVLANDTDLDGDTLTVTGVSNATNGTATLNANGTVTFTPALNFNGNAGFSYAISDGNGGTASGSVTVTVTPVNDPPSITTQPVTGATVGQLYSYDVNATDPENNTLTYALTQAPAGMTINATTGLISWTPTAAQAGANPVTVLVTDNGTTGAPPVADPKSATQSFTITVGAGVDLDIDRFTVPGTGRVGRALTLSINVRNNGTVNQPRTATLTGTQNGVQVYNRSLQVSDPVGGGTSQFAFPAFTPTVTGTISWKVEIFDDNPDVDVATGTTTVTR